jgi:GTP pyrophosphokinase
MSQEQLHPEISGTVRPKTVEEFIDKSEYLSSIKSFAEKAHEGQRRLSGEPYFSHCIEVARILYEEWGIGNERIIGAALLHDTTEDTTVTLDTIRDKFGTDIAFLVDGVSNLRSEKGVWSKEQGDKETLKKVFDKTLDDPIVAVLKLADRTHNMRTLGYLPPEKQIRKANETLNIYAKLAESLGMWKVMRELEDLAYKYVYPNKYDELSKLRDNDPRTDDNFVAHIKSVLATIAEECGVDAIIETNINSLAKIDKKMGDNPIDKINDLISFRVIVKGTTELQTRGDVGKMLMAVRNHFSSILDEKRFDDFYSKPKKNGYSTVQDTYDFTQGSTEIAITSEKKEEFNNWGIISLIKNGQKDLQEYALKLIFTPTGSVKFFPRMATGLDFAYSINPELGARGEKVIINGTEFPITTVLPNGADIEIKMSKDSNISPNRNFLNYGLLPTTKQKINKQILEEDKLNIEKTGKDIVSEVITKQGIVDLDDILRIDKFEPALKDLLLMLGCDGTLQHLYYKLGKNIISAKTFESKLIESGLTKEEMGITSVMIEGFDVPGILKRLGRAISKRNGNIKYFINTSHSEGTKDTFTLRLVAEGLKEADEKDLSKLFSKDKRFQKVIVV